MNHIQESRSGRKILAFCLAFALVVPLGAAGQAGAQALPDFTDLVEANAPAIVNVSTVRRPTAEEAAERRTLEDLLREFYRDRLPQEEQDEAPQEDGRDSPERSPRERTSMGSGFIISGDGYIVTNHHVVEGADEITVTLNDRREFSAGMVGTDSNSDLALLKIDAEGLQQVTLADSEDLEVGEWVLAIGSPFGLRYSVAAGIVSYIGRDLPSMQGVGDYVSYIQTDVAINPGHSGGPLFNLDGEVVGINSQIFTNSGGSIGLSFAIPVDVARNVVAQLRETGAVERGWMGVAFSEVSPELAEAFNLDTPHGALVNQVVEDSPAAEAGFRSGDVIVNFDGHEIQVGGDLRYEVGMTMPGKDVEVEIIRDGEPSTLTMTVGNLEESQGLLSQSRAPEEHGMGLIVGPLEEEAREALGVDTGVTVEEVVGEVGREAGFQPGDVILSVNNQPVESVETFVRVVDELPAGRLLPVLVAREGRQSFFTVRIPEE